jgi:predicted lipopolysaccharide heptosyltransferase III
LNILLIQLKRIGDLILTVPAVAALRKHFPDAKLSLVVSHGCRELVPAIPGISRTFVAKGNFADATEWLTVASNRYSYCLDFTGNDRSALVTFLSRARKRITYTKVKRAGIRALTYNQFVDSKPRFAHTVDLHLALLGPLGIHDASPTVHLSVPKRAREHASKLLGENDISSDFIIFHPGSARPEKFWIASRWAELIGYAATKLRMRCVLTGGASTLEQEHIAAIRSATRQPVLDLSGKMDLLALTALIARGRMLVTVDSAPMHLAGAMRTPQVILFGPTNPFHWRPRSSRALIVQAGSPEPVTHFSPEHTRVPMNEISTEQVIRAMESVLSASAAPSQ